MYSKIAREYPPIWTNYLDGPKYVTLEEMCYSQQSSAKLIHQNGTHKHMWDNDLKKKAFK